MNRKNKKGFATLMVVIILSGIISVILFVSLSDSYSAQSNIYNRELKETTKLAANSCIEALRILLAEFGEFHEVLLQIRGVPNCTIHSLEIVDDNRIVKVESVIEKFHTFLRAKINIHSNKIISIEEVKSF